MPTKQIIDLMQNLLEFEKIASFLLMVIALGVVVVLISMAWFIIRKLPGILSEWLTGFNNAIEKLASSVVCITADVAGAHANTVSLGSLMGAHDIQAKQILFDVQEIRKMQSGTRDVINEVSDNVKELNITLKNRPCLTK